MTDGNAQPRPRGTSAQGTRPTEPRQDVKKHERETLNGLIGEQVIHALGTPGDLLTVQIRSLWENRYRVNVFTGVDVTSARVAHSFFLVVDEDGNILTSAPGITRRH